MTLTNPLTVVAIDPGVTTGIAIAYVRPHHPTIEMVVRQGKMDHELLWRMLHKVNPTIVVCEDFEYRPGKARDGLVLFSLELIGVAKLYAATQLKEIKMQKAAEGKSYYNNARLKELKLYSKGYDHGRDATRHLLHWWTFGAGYKFNQSDLTFKLVAEIYGDRPAGE